MKIHIEYREYARIGLITLRLTRRTLAGINVGQVSTVTSITHLQTYSLERC
jgi:hypothetical protein